MPSLKSLLAGAAALAITVVKAQDDVIFWHNRYHALLAMASYNPNYDQLCPAEEFTKENLRKNFVDSSCAPWEVLDRWGPTARQGGGFTAMIPEMDKVLLVFTGDYWKLENLPTQTPVSMLSARPGNAIFGAAKFRHPVLAVFISTKPYL